MYRSTHEGPTPDADPMAHAVAVPGLPGHVLAGALRDGGKAALPAEARVGGVQPRHCASLVLHVRGGR